MKNLSYVITFCLILSSSIAFTQNDTLDVRLLADSSDIPIYTYQILEIDSFKNKPEFNGIPDQWVDMLYVSLLDDEFFIPLNSSAKSVVISIDSKAYGYCNRILWWSACDRLEIYEHGNGCRYMNTITVNGCNDGHSGLILDGTRVVPFYYEKSRMK